MRIIRTLLLASSAALFSVQVAGCKKKEKDSKDKTSTAGGNVITFGDVPEQQSTSREVQASAHAENESKSS
jgi:hypothetical protein